MQDSPLVPAPTTFFMTVRDIAFWIRSARADARLNRFIREDAEAAPFDCLYGSTADPFGSELPQFRYQLRKYDALLSMLPGRRYRDVLDIGCGLGTLARRLAPFADRVLGLDVSGEAVRQAQELSRGIDHLEFAQLDVLDIRRCGGSFDLILVADTLYYVGSLTDARLKQLVDEVASRLEPGGLLLVANHFFFGFDSASRETRRIHDAFRWAPRLEPVREQRRAFYLATLLRRPPPAPEAA